MLPDLSIKISERNKVK